MVVKMDSKNNDRSTTLRSEGNEFYSKKIFYEALLKYNESLCLAVPCSENLGFAYANRSAVYYEMKLYEQCVKNIRLAKKNNYPEKNYEILNKREEKCLEMMKQQKNESKLDVSSYFKLSHPPNSKLPFIADCLELKCDQKFGRYIITNRALRIGDVIAIEEAFCKIIHDKFIYQRCAGCFKDNMLDLMPCTGCQKGFYCPKFRNQSLH